MVILVLFEAVLRRNTWRNRAHVLPFSRPSCYFKTRPPSCALGTSFYTVSEGRDLMTYVSDNYTSYSAPSPLRLVRGTPWRSAALFILIMPVLAASIADTIIASVHCFVLLVSCFHGLLEGGAGAGEMHLRLCLLFGITKIACYSSFNKKVRQNNIKLTKVNMPSFF